ncbi:MAG: hypothetical protein K0S24_3954, partial [Sphingobacterium sp.]|nr:hypothetical protein [Sphingobacterium sp.]
MCSVFFIKTRYLAAKYTILKFHLVTLHIMKKDQSKIIREQVDRSALREHSTP